MSKKILCCRHYRDLLAEIIESLEKKKGGFTGSIRFKASEVGDYEELKRKGFRKLTSNGVIRVVGKDGNANVYEISYDVYCIIKGDKAKCKITRKDVKKLKTLIDR